MAKTYNTRVNDDFKFEDLSAANLDFIALDDKNFHLLHGGKTYHAELMALDRQKKIVRLKINGKPFIVQIEDKYDQLIKKMGLQTAVSHHIKDVKAPMPGLVLDILVKTGQAVKTGDPLLILEAMKMENVIKAHGEGIIKQIHVSKGAPVEKGQLLIELA